MKKKVMPGDKVLYAYEKKGFLSTSEGLALSEVLSTFTIKAGKYPWQRKKCYLLWDFEDNHKSTAYAKDCIYLDDAVTKKLMELEATAANSKDKKKKGEYL